MCIILITIKIHESKIARKGKIGKVIPIIGDLNMLSSVIDKTNIKK